MFVSISAEPQVLASSLSDRDTARAAPAVIAWTRLNHAVLLEYWNEQDGLFREQSAAYVERLQKL
jgi:hypothetical protein